MSNLEQIVTEQLTKAAADTHRRSAQVVAHDGPLRQTVVALGEGAELSEHNAPPAASVQVLQGRIRVEYADRQDQIGAGELVALAQERHSVTALAESAFLLTTVTGIN